MKAIFVLLFSAFAGLQVANASVNDTTRLVPVKGAVNFRDLGGYLTHEGTHVKWGKVYRSAEISKLTDDDLKLLVQKHIKSVVDFRSDEEVARAKDRLPANAAYLQLPAGSESLTGIMAVLPKLNNGDSLMISFYSQTAHLKEKYKPFFQELLKMPDGDALLFHCTAGKDRTGIGAALFLHVLGVPDETVLEDYLATNEYRKAENEKMVKMMMQMNIKEQVARDLAEVKPEYLIATVKAIFQQYGSVDQFITDEIGLTADDIALLRKKYTK
ncbi:tyrosine-protein phosphatase [Pedobacter cryoconitis]|uniref:Protein-tyrosine phosphatase n=1 Tax=Pedobacter cryoconitis TaxID=188932 RepID=A0A7X0MIY7_9SPHI|nr:tyrosine-protein phosphatase [Pedobacter cryoconitis]MBB6500912.1 protein-tyrosine phosphatase [Pedobacter cryoconitis]